MLRRLWMSVEETINCYDNLAKKVFLKLNRWGDGKYKAELLEEVIKVIVKERMGANEAQVLDDGALGGICKMCVHTRQLQVSSSYVWLDLSAQWMPTTWTPVYRFFSTLTCRRRSLPSPVLYGKLHRQPQLPRFFSSMFSLVPLHDDNHILMVVLVGTTRLHRCWKKQRWSSPAEILPASLALALVNQRAKARLLPTKCGCHQCHQGHGWDSHQLRKNSRRHGEEI